MTGLSSEKGEVELNDKEILKRGKNALHKPVFSGLGFSKKKGEVKASQIFQSSVHDHIQNKEVSFEKKKKVIMEMIEGNEIVEAYNKFIDR